MRGVAAALTSEPQTIRSLAMKVYDTDVPTPAQIEATRRASAKLADLGHAKRGWHQPRWSEWTGDGPRPNERTVRVPLTDDERAAIRAARRAAGLSPKD
jgi:hypothetical protein